jgi:competence protein ComEA
MRRSRSDDQSEPTDVEVGRRFSRVFDGVYGSSAGAPDDRADDRESAAADLQHSGSFTSPDELAVDAGAAQRALSAFDPGRRGLRALAVVAVLVMAGAAVFAWRSRPQAEPVSPRPAVSIPVSSPSPSGIVVAVSGRVQHPGLVRLQSGARVADAIAAAGGVLPDTDLATVNLARKVVDGELILVGVAPLAGGGAAAASGGAGGQVNLNTATLAEFDTLPGVGPVLAQRIVDYRTKHGGFRSVDELRQIDGVGDARYAELKDLVTV